MTSVSARMESPELPPTTYTRSDEPVSTVYEDGSAAAFGFRERCGEHFAEASFCVDLSDGVESLAFGFASDDPDSVEADLDDGSFDDAVLFPEDGPLRLGVGVLDDGQLCFWV